MKKLSEKRKAWLIKRCHKIENQRHKRNLKRKKKNEAKRTNPIINNKYRYNSKKIVTYNNGICHINAPEYFSLLNNPEDTLMFFYKVFGAIDNAKYHSTIFFNLSDIKNVSVDAIMYLIALLQNIKKIDDAKIVCIGNTPKDKVSSNAFESSGFYDYVTPKYAIVKNIKSNLISIANGLATDPQLAGSICDFIHKNSNLDIIGTKKIYPMLMELMANTKQHAYNNQTKMAEMWYIFVEKCQEYIQFVFLDTGAGIPNTIRTTFIEKISNMIKNDDAFFIASALKGDFRTETKKEYRGKGLPEIYAKITSNVIYDFSVISCGGKCDVINNIIMEQKLPLKLKGTLFCWKIKI